MSNSLKSQPTPKSLLGSGILNFLELKSLKREISSIGIKSDKILYSLNSNGEITISKSKKPLEPPQIKFLSGNFPSKNSPLDSEEVNIFSDVSDTDLPKPKLDSSDFQLETSTLTATEIMQKAKMKRDIEKMQK